MDKPNTKRIPPAQSHGIKAGKVALSQRADGVIVLTHESRPAVEVEVPSHMLERWALRQLREGVFA